MNALLDSLEKQLDQINGRIAFFMEQKANNRDTFVVTAHLNRYLEQRAKCLAAIARVESAL